VYFKTETLVGAFILLALSLFVYMSFQLGSVRLNLARYATYTVGFKDVSSLLPKADIKIAGVKVGWVDAIYLDSEDMRVKVTVKVFKEYRLFNDASAVVRQEGMLGVKYLEVIPGTPEAGRIEPGGALPFQAHPAVGIDEIFASVNTLAKQIEGLGNSLEASTHEFREILQGVRDRLTKIDQVFTDIGEASESFKETSTVLQAAGKQVSGLLEFGEESGKDSTALVKKLSSGQGSLARFLADEQLYEDIKCTSEYARSCIEGVRNIGVGLDNHFEVLPNSFFDNKRPLNTHCRKTNVKWYGAAYIASSSGVFGKIGLTFSSKGYAKHKGIGCDDEQPFVHGHRNSIRLNLQFGKYWYPYAALRGGIFEGTAGVALDWWIAYTRFKWLSTFMVFDFRGYNRFDNDRNPHLKWLNRLFFSKNVYLAFGADDFISRCNKSGFVGLGAYFSVPDVFGGC